MILYLHGFRSSPRSFKARVVQERLAELGRGDELICPQLSASPKEAMDLVTRLVDRYHPSQLAVIGSMNLDLRSQLKNSEVALLIRSKALAEDAAALVENSFAHNAYRVELRGHRLLWRAPPGADFGDAISEPEAGFRRRLLVDLLAPFAPDEML